MLRKALHAFLIHAAAFAAVTVFPVTSSAQDTPPMAERLPLVPESLLLDVVRTAEGRFVAVGERGHVITSSNGEEWTQAEVVPTRSTLTAVAAAGNELWAGGHDTVLIHSEDGGETWSLQYYDPDRRQPIMDLHFVDERRGFAIGAYGLMLVTEDGGESWEDHEVSEEGWHLNGLVDLGDGNLVITGEAGYSYFSHDGGESWETVEMPYPGSMFGALRVGPCVMAFGLRGNVQQSCDRGETWEAFDTPSELSLAGAGYQDGRVMFVGNSGQILIRDEDGSFHSEIHPSGVDFAAVLPAGDGGWVLVGEGGAQRFLRFGDG